ncbi:protein-disulfide reductase DsbD family protein [Ichthyenterobacterium magnum]|uniref:Thiol:disulfide interchange protein DsbD n=1 Tax=Ichthyenterobacterium magnum TaxID=1230530 RepID=A0A420DV94_9FLAO|nr:protein-disulfide reductase DsbD domain-containing protein [Ichthyenterobacterium magnum]RKE98185.1 thiol:disulfide interchange protein DsbD [Ichthyenterobacterium magnum]
MKHIVFSIFCLFVITTSTAQILEPVKWTTSVEKISDTEYNLISTATIDKGWHLYSQNVPEDGPIPTTFVYKEHPNYKLVGKTSQEKGHTIDDPIFKMKITFFEDKAEFKQRIKILNKELSIVKGEVEFMVCDDSKCLPPDYVDLIFDLKTEKKSEVNANELQLDLNDNASQIFEPVKWSTYVEKVSDTEYNLVSKAKIDEGWHLYSQNISEEKEIKPIPTEFVYASNSDFEIVGTTTEEKGLTVEDPVFDMKIKYFEDEAEFRQRIKLLNNRLTTINGEVGFMACDDKQCTAPTYEDLSFNLTKSVAASKENFQVESAEKTNKESSKKGLWTIFFLAFLSGFAALLTPCVFPMIPMTVSFFTKQSKSKAAGIKNAIIYGLAIIVIYVFLGAVVTWVFGADALNALSTNVWFNIIFFLLLIVFAFSFLGAFEIVLPNSWANKVDRQADRGGMIGIFFMALALAIVSFSCTGPIVGTLLVEAASKGGIAPFVGMFGFSLALALPFALFAAFPGWLNSLPKSGGWLNTVKVVLGFLELALAFKFLSNADLVLQLHWLEREVFIAIWIAIFGVLALYLFGKIQLPHDSPLTHISVGRLSLGLIVLSFTIYMIPGLWGAPLNLISAFPPPLDYSESPYGVGYTKLGSGGTSTNHSDLPDGGHLLAPHDILAFNDYDKGLAYAKKVGKPIMIDFTGWACVNCRKMEQNVWVNNKVLNVLKNDVVLISLYVDDKRKLSDDEVIDSKLKPGKKLKYIGQKWSELQTIKYKTNTQPFYVLMNHNEDNLIQPVGYTPDVDEYYNWLETGLENFKN